MNCWSVSVQQTSFSVQQTSVSVQQTSVSVQQTSVSVQQTSFRGVCNAQCLHRNGALRHWQAIAVRNRTLGSFSTSRCQGQLTRSHEERLDLNCEEGRLIQSPKSERTF